MKFGVLIKEFDKIDKDVPILIGCKNKILRPAEIDYSIVVYNRKTKTYRPYKCDADVNLDEVKEWALLIK